jgi:hypothetical protein
MKNFKKLSLRLLILVTLIGGVFFVHKTSVSAEACVWVYQDCINNCEQGNGGCYAACYIDYLNCTNPYPIPD